MQYPPIWPSLRTSILYLIGSFLCARSVKFIITFLPLQNLRCSEHSKLESSCKNHRIYKNKKTQLSFLKEKKISKNHQKKWFADHHHFVPLISDVSKIALRVEGVDLSFLCRHPSLVIPGTVRYEEAVLSFAIALVSPAGVRVEMVLRS